MKPTLQRFVRRVALARRFASQAAGPADFPALFLAGLARARPFGDSSLYSRIGRALASEVAPRVRKAGDSRIHLRLTEGVDLMVFEELFLEGIYPLDRIPFTPDTIVDAGACTGMFTLLAHARYPSARLIVVEPQPENFRYLTRHLTENDIPAEKHQAALAGKAGTLLFSGSGFWGSLVDQPGANSFAVRGVTVDDLFGQLRTDSLLIKMDIEGAERDVLPRLLPRLPARCAVLLETHHHEAVCSEYLAPYAASGFASIVVRRRPAPDDVGEYVERLLLRCE